MNQTYLEHTYFGMRALSLLVRLYCEGTLSEGQCCKALAIDRVEFRTLVDGQTLDIDLSNLVRAAKCIDPQAWSLNPRTGELYDFDSKRRGIAIEKAAAILNLPPPSPEHGYEQKSPDDGRVASGADQLSALERDAARYRYLRGVNPSSPREGGIFIGITPANVIVTEEDADRAVDDARQNGINGLGRLADVISQRRAANSLDPAAIWSSELIEALTDHVREAHDEVEAHRTWLIEHPDEQDPGVDWVPVHPDTLITLDGALTRFFAGPGPPSHFRPAFRRKPRRGSPSHF